MFGPAGKAAVGGGLDTKIGRELCIDVFEGRGYRNPVRDAEAESVGLSNAMIWILPYDNDTNILKRRTL